MKKTKSKKIKTNKSRIILVVIICIILLLILGSGFMVYKNLFQNNSSTRFENIEKYKLTKKEIKSAKEKFSELENMEEIDIYVNSKIIRIFIKLNEDEDFEKIKSLSDDVISSFSEKNLGYYDIEIFIESLNEESDIYPQIGYKYKTSEKFVW